MHTVGLRSGHVLSIVTSFLRQGPGVPTRASQGRRLKPCGTERMGVRAR